MSRTPTFQMSVQEVEIESIRKTLASKADTGHSHECNVFGSTSF